MRTNMRDLGSERTASFLNCALTTMTIGLATLVVGSLYHVIDDVAISAMVVAVLALPMVATCSKLGGSANRRSGR